MKFFSGTGSRLVPPHAVPSGALDQLMATHQVTSAFVAENVGNFRAAPTPQTAPVVGVTRRGLGLPGRRSQPMELTGACWVGSNVVPVALDDDGVKPVADHLLTARSPRASFFGPQREVLGLWESVKHRWSDPFAVREDQPFLVASEQSLSQPHPEVRLARRSDFAKVLPASAAMFTEEVGYAPDTSKESSYVLRVAHLVTKARTYVVMRENKVVFKADIGAAAGQICQIQGVWVAPEYRGQGLAAPFMTSVVEDVRHRWPTVSLYVNSYNLPALKTYHRAGFRQVSSFATVLF